MPLQRLQKDEVTALAASIGINLTSAEAEIFTNRIESQIAAMEAFLELRIEEHRPPLSHLTRDPGYRPGEAEDPHNAFIRKCRVTGAETGPLAGRSVGLKDHIAVAGVPMTLGSHFLDGYIPDFDATVVTRLLDAGATITGKMNMEDFSFGGPGVSGVGDFGRPLNPHNPDHVTGGSSSGPAVAVVTGAVDMALGGDQGGSIRIPAASSGCVGLKATHGLIPHSGVFGLEASIDYVGPMTRTVEDMALALSVLAGPDGYDPRQGAVPPVLPDYLGALGQSVAGLRIGILKEGFGSPAAEADVERLVQDAIEVLRAAGATVETVSVPLHTAAVDALSPLFLEGARVGHDTNFAGSFGGSVLPASFMLTYGRSKRSASHELPLNYKMMLLAGTYAHERTHGRLYAKAYAARAGITAQYRAAFAKVDVLVMPTSPVKARRYVTPSDHIDAIERTMFGGTVSESIAILAANTAPFNYTGFPAVSIPCGKSAGLPVGLQIVAPHFRDDLLVTVAHAYQQAVAFESFYPAPLAAAE